MRAQHQEFTNISLNDLQFNNAVKDYESFVYIVSHDFNAPIRQISEFMRLLTDSLDDLGDDQILYVHFIKDALKRMFDMQSALLKLSRLTSNDYQFTAVDTQEIVRNIINQTETETEDYLTYPKITYTDLPIAYGVTTMLDTLFRTLIDNACRYGSENGEQKIHIKSYDRQDQTVFEITDNGIGIDAAFTEVVFDMFRRLHGQDDYGGGVGAGLTIAQKIIDYHQGNIWIKSKIGQGTTVLFSLPKNMS
jgi:light-regulated signal transduction histidine kinase (bacteriophytochrome)